MTNENTGREATGSENRVARGVATIVAVGVFLGLAQNYIARAGGASRGLPWIREEIVLEDLESFQPSVDGATEGADPRAEGAGPAVHAAEAEPNEVAVPVLPPDVNDPMALRGEPEGSDLPVIPEIGRPLQMQLPAVKKLFDANAAVIIDARTPEEYAEGHIPGSVNMPYDAVVTDPARLEAFDAQGKPIIVYCGGGTCEVSMNLAFAMIQAGHSKLLVFMGGWPEWQGAGYPVATGAAAEVATR